MTFEVEADPERRILRCSFRAHKPIEEGEAQVIAIRRRAAELGYGLLYDLRQLPSRPPIAEMFRFPRALNESGVPTPRRIALICDAHLDAFEFYETTANNAGHNVRVFDNEDDAIDWLTEPPTHMA